MSQFAPGFLWGASTAPHQIEGNNLNSDWWQREQQIPGMELSGDACDSYHRFGEDIALLADAGLNAYRFGLEWARIEPIPGHVSRAELAHYRRMIDACLERGVAPVVTLQHFTTPLWFAESGGWLAADASERFQSYVESACSILDGVEWVVTMNEPNMQALIITSMKLMQESAGEAWQSPTVDGDATRGVSRPAVLPEPDVEVGAALVSIHHAVRGIVREKTEAKVGWTIANGALTALPGGEEKLIEVRYAREDLYLDGSDGDDFVGVQSYSTQGVDANGLVPHPQRSDNTLVGTAYRPDSLEMAVRHTADRTKVLPILVTENGIATADDAQRISYTRSALEGLTSAIDDGIDVRGYLHWSLLDNFEWGHWGPTFGLVAVDHETFVRTPKPSLSWLGNVARQGGLG